MSSRKFFTFFLGEDMFGIDILLVREIIHGFSLTKVELSPEHVSGLLNLRGQVVTVIDPAIALSMDRVKPSENICLILKPESELNRLAVPLSISEGIGEDSAGLMLDDIGDVIEFPEDEIEPSPANLKGINGKFLSGVVRKDGELMLIMNISEVLNSSVL